MGCALPECSRTADPVPLLCAAALRAANTLLLDDGESTPQGKTWAMDPHPFPAAQNGSAKLATTAAGALYALSVPQQPPGGSGPLPIRKSLSTGECSEEVSLLPAPDWLVAILFAFCLASTGRMLLALVHNRLCLQIEG